MFPNGTIRFFDETIVRSTRVSGKLGPVASLPTLIRRTGLLLAVLAGILSASSAEERTWTSSDGRSLEGSLLEAHETEVSIRRSDGRRFTIPLSSLSESDREFVRSRMAELARKEGFRTEPYSEWITGEWIQVPKQDFGLLLQVFGAPDLARREEPVPLFVHLHGAGARANSVEIGEVEIAAQRLAGEEIYEEHPCLILVPTCPPDTYWGDQAAALESLIDRICDSVPIDRNRIYLSGYSMGARGIGQLIERRPHHYAAALFADGEAKMDWVDSTDTALWFTFSGERDLDGARAVAKAYTAAGKTAHFDGFPDHTHNQIHWTLARTEGVYDWCFGQIRGATSDGAAAAAE